MKSSQQSLPFTPFDVKFQANYETDPDSSALIICVGQTDQDTGMLHLYRFSRDKKSFDLLSSMETEKQAGLKCCLPLPDGSRRILTGNFQGKLSIWDSERLGETPVQSWTAHERLIYSIDYVDRMIVSGSRDGTIKIWDLRSNPLVPIIKFDSETDLDRSDCWVVNAQPQRIAAGFSNGDARVFDLRNRIEVWNDNLASGVSTIQFMNEHDKQGWVLGTVEGSLHFFHESCNDHPCRISMKAHTSTLWSLHHLMGIYWISGGGDGFLKFHACEHDFDGMSTRTFHQKCLSSSSALSMLDVLRLFDDHLIATVSFDKTLHLLY